MEEAHRDPSPIETAGRDLFDYAIDREDVKWLLGRLPESIAPERNSVEYELQVLKIIAVGWRIRYFLEGSPFQAPLSERYWSAVRDFSHQLSTTTGMVTGHAIDYFETLKARLDGYVAAMAGQRGASAPAEVIGPAFAEACGDGDDLFVSMTGAKMFASASARVHDYLKAVGML